jgi:hypothetical protein
MTDTSKYRNVSLTHEAYNTLQQLSKVLLPGAKLSISKTIEAVAKEKAEKLNGKISSRNGKW